MNLISNPAFWSRFQFGFTLTYHYLFPQLTMGLSWIIVYFKWRALRSGNEEYNKAARFWAKILGLNFAVGVVTGIPMEFQFGTNWAGFTRFAGGVIGQTLAMEGMFAFFLESAFVGALIWGEKRLGPRYHFLAAAAVALGGWISAFFILVTNAFMQHPAGYRLEPGGVLNIASARAYLLNPWALVQFAHNQMAAVVTGAFVVTAVGAFYALRQLHVAQAQLYLRTGTLVGLIASVLVAFPTGDQQAKMVGNHQPVTLAAMEGRFSGGTNAGVAMIGQPNVAARRLDNSIELPDALSFLAYGHFGSYVHGLDQYPTNVWPDNIELLYYSFHLMITLGTIFIVLMAYATFQKWRGRLQSNTWLLWVLMLAFPFPYIANTLGWMTAELGRQPWLIYGLFQTRDGYSKVVSNGDTIFTLIGFISLYLVLGVLFLYLVGREISHGPDGEDVILSIRDHEEALLSGAVTNEKEEYFV
jgi:cytochrome d ubiquinol oxidase subunit I